MTLPVNPDPTVTNLSLTVGRGAGTLTGTVTVWEMVANVVVPQQTITLPSGRWLVTLLIAGYGSKAPRTAVAQQDTTLASPGTVTIPATNLNHIRDFTASRSVQVVLDVKRRSGSTWVNYTSTGTGNGTVTLPAAAVPATGDVPPLGASNGQVIGSAANLQFEVIGRVTGANTAVQTAGGTLVRNDPQWKQLCPSSATFDTTTQAAYDAWFTDIAAKGQKAIVFLCPVVTSPAWAATSGVAGNPPADWATFETFVTNFLTRWGANVSAVELVNEPNYSGGTSPATAAQIAAWQPHLYTPTKAYSSTITVLGGCLSLCDTTYLQQLYTAGIKNYMDALSLHPYSVDNGQFDTPVSPPISYDPSVAQAASRYRYDILPGVTAIHDVMRNNNDGTKPIWVTEMGWKTGRPYSGTTWGSYDVSEAQQATYSAYIYRALSRLAYVDAVHFYAARDTANDGASEYGWADYWGNRQKPVVAALAAAKAGLVAGTG